VLIAAVGAVGTLWATAAAFVLSVALVAAVRLPGAGKPAHPASGLWRDAAEGLAFVWRDRLLRTITLLSMAIVALYLPVEGVILPAHFLAEGAPDQLGLVVMTMSGGGVVGALVFGAIGHRLRRRTAFVLALVGSCGALLAMAPLPPYAALLPIAAATGLLYGPINPLANYTMQTHTPERLRPRRRGDDVVGVRGRPRRLPRGRAAGAVARRAAGVPDHGEPADGRGARVGAAAGPPRARRPGIPGRTPPSGGGGRCRPSRARRCRPVTVAARGRGMRRVSTGGRVPPPRGPSTA
jgi:hypothetical protein